MTAAIYVAKSGNTKTGEVAATYASTASTCPKSCPLAANGCYAETGHVGMTVRRLNAAKASAIAAARDEARAIDSGAVYAGLPLRLHVSGDCATNGAAKVVSGAAERYMKRGGGKAWSYTHAWRKVARASWGAVSVLASMESAKDGLAALKAGYAPACVVPRHESPKAYQRDGVTWIPCPQQTREGITCAQCGLCMDAESLRKRACGIAFAAHGNSSKRVLTVLS